MVINVRKLLNIIFKLSIRYFMNELKQIDFKNILIKQVNIFNINIINELSNSYLMGGRYDYSCFIIELDINNDYIDYFDFLKKSKEYNNLKKLLTKTI